MEKTPSEKSEASACPRLTLAERVREIQERARLAGFASSGAPGADKAFMDEMWGED